MLFDVLHSAIRIEEPHDVDEASLKSLNQGTLHTRESYGTLCAVVNQLYNRLLVQLKN